MTEFFYVTLMRHATATKNIAEIYGGFEHSLSPSAQNELQTVVENFQSSGIPFEQIYCTRRKQCEETAILLAESFDIDLIKSDFLEPVNLGVVEGLSKEKIKTLYPMVYHAIDAWHQGKIEISELHIPGMEDPSVFFERAIRLIEVLRVKQKHTIVVGTRSILIAIASVLLGRSPIKHGGYREIPWPNSGYITFQLTHSNQQVLKRASTIHI